ncbi:hypothetical protein BH24ACI1_BH24ACI1_24530 [soil metagenome]
MVETLKIDGPKTLLWQDRKFLWLISSVAVVAVFEFLSLAGWHLPTAVGAPFFAVVILAIGWQTIWKGLKALVKLNFRSINLLMVIAVIGAFILGEFE